MILFDSVAELIMKAEAENKLISEIALAQSALEAGLQESEIIDKMKYTLSVMKESVVSGLE